MLSFIIVSKNQEERKGYIANFCKEKAISIFDQLLVSPEGTSFGIEQVRDLQKTAFLAPVKSKQKLIILDDAQLLTIEAQNALLKMLEEPPAHTSIFLSTTTEQFFLPTILSRCKVIILIEEKKGLSEEDAALYTSMLDTLISGSVGNKLALAEKIGADKQNVSIWFDGMSIFLRNKVFEDPTNPSFLHVLKQLQQAYTYFQSTNINIRELLEHCFLTITQ